MKKYILLSLVGAAVLFCTSFFPEPVQAAKTIKADIQSARIPAGTTLNMEMLETVSTASAAVGDEFSAMLKDDKLVNGQVVLPAGSVIRGTFDKIIPPKRLSKSAVLYMTFDHIVTPTGRQIPVNAGLYNYAQLTLDGGIYQNGNYSYAIRQNWNNTKKLIKATIDWGKGTGENLQYVCVPIAAVGGVFGGAAYYIGDSIADLFKKGNDVTLHQGQIFQVMLTQPLNIPIH